MMYKIGSGKFSDVYKAVRLGNTREEDTFAVLKVLKPGIINLIQLIERRCREKSK